MSLSPFRLKLLIVILGMTGLVQQASAGCANNCLYRVAIPGLRGQASAGQAVIVANGASRNWSDGTYATSCEGYLTGNSTYAYEGATGSGLYTISISGTPTPAYCDMVTDGGGWTLVGRTASGGSSASFGYEYSTGSVTNDTTPYSLGSVQVLNPTEILFGAYAGNFTWGAYSYTKTIPTGFWTSLASSSKNTGWPTPVAGGVTNFGMGLFTGYSASNNGFYFRGSADVNSGGTVSYYFYGLLSSGWSTYYSDGVAGIPGSTAQPAGYGGYLNTQQGWIFVR